MAKTMKLGEVSSDRSLLPLSLLFCGVVFDAAAMVYPPLSLGAADALRMRLFRLATVAAMALPLLAFLFSGLAAHADAAARRGFHAMLFGAVTMPIVLAAAAFTRLEFRLLLPLPALAVVYGAVSAALLARRHGRPELWGWRLIAASTAAGLVMGLYAFDAPLVPPFAGAYDDLPRRVIRGVHESAIASGIALIFLSRLMKGAEDENRSRRHRRRQAANA
jgi:hypothetical protein